MTQDTTGVGIELVDTGRLAVEADLLIEESVSALSVRDCHRKHLEKVTYWKPASELISLALGSI